jgi:hypothetical protein
MLLISQLKTTMKVKLKSETKAKSHLKDIYKIRTKFFQNLHLHKMFKKKHLKKNIKIYMKKK